MNERGARGREKRNYGFYTGTQPRNRPGGARTSGFRRDRGGTSSGLRAGIAVVTRTPSQSGGHIRAFEADSRGYDEVCGGYTGKGSLRAERHLNLKVIPRQLFSPITPAATPSAAPSGSPIQHVHIRSRACPAPRSLYQP